MTDNDHSSRNSQKTKTKTKKSHHFRQMFLFFSKQFLPYIFFFPAMIQIKMPSQLSRSSIIFSQAPSKTRLSAWMPLNPLFLREEIIRCCQRSARIYQFGLQLHQFSGPWTDGTTFQDVRKGVCGVGVGDQDCTTQCILRAAFVEHAELVGGRMIHELVCGACDVFAV